jgi:hypothetical protein
MRFRGKRAIILSLAAVLTGLVAIGGAWLLKDSGQVKATGDGQSSLPSVEPTPEAVVSESPSAAPSPSPSPSPSKPPSPKPKPKPSPKPLPSKVQAPPPLPTEPSGCSPHYEGTNVPKEQVGTALSAAAARRFWTVSQVSLPTNLVKAVAEQESGWQSAIVSCVGAVGAMQVLPATADWMNNRFGTSFNVRDVTGNAMLGSEYLQWLIKYFGDLYFDGQQGDYTIRASDCSQDPAVPDHREWCLLNAVISAYNVGHGTVDRSATDGDTTYYVNHSYIENVRALMSRF